MHNLLDVKQVHVSLNEAHIPIWRRLLVPGNITLHDFHLLLQGAMGWRNEHLYDFEIGDDKYTSFEYEHPGHGYKNSRNIQLKTISKKAKKFQYRYDFGDDWTHTISIERKTHNFPSYNFFAACIEGENSCPPENVGGPYGYEEQLHALSDTNHDAHEITKDWLGKFDPKAFSCHQANSLMALIASIEMKRNGAFDCEPFNTMFW